MLLLALIGGVSGISVSKGHVPSPEQITTPEHAASPEQITSPEHAASPKSRSFRSFVVPYKAIMGKREDVSSLPPSLANGHLLAYLPYSPSTDELFLFLPGSTMPCEDYRQLLETIAAKMNVLCIPYDNRKMIGKLCRRNGRCYPDLRLKAFNGSFSNVPGNNIEARLVGALDYLARTDSEVWFRYLDTSEFSLACSFSYLDVPYGRPLWSRIRAAGHSQGAGAAAFIGYQRILARVVQFSGVCDRSDWTKRLGTPATPESRFFGFASSYDTIVCPNAVQVKNWKAEGALTGASWPPHLGLEGNLTVASIGNSRTVISNIPPPGCNSRFNLRCPLDGHISTAVNVWPGHSPYADGLWQLLCGV